jgi:hypothetical protein
MKRKGQYTSPQGLYKNSTKRNMYVRRRINDEHAPGGTGAVLVCRRSRSRVETRIGLDVCGEIGDRNTILA